MLKPVIRDILKPTIRDIFDAVDAGQAVYIPEPPPPDLEGDIAFYLDFTQGFITSTAYTGDQYLVGVYNSVTDISGAGAHFTPPPEPQQIVNPNPSHNLGNYLVFTGAESMPLVGPAFTVLTGSKGIWFRTSSAALMTLAETTGVSITINAGVVTVDVNGTTHSTGAGFADGQWHFVVAGWGTGGTGISIDGAVLTLDAVSNVLAATADPWYIGATSAATQKFIGDLLEASLHRSVITDTEISDRWAGGAGAKAKTGPTIDTFETVKVWYKPNANVAFRLNMTVLENAPGAHIECKIARDLADELTIYGKYVDLVAGSQSNPFYWYMGSNGLDNNLQGHLATLTIRNAAGQVIATASTQFDITDNWAAIVRYTSRRLNNFDDGTVDTQERWNSRAARMRKWGFNYLTCDHPTDPWNLNPPGDSWVNIDDSGETLYRNQIEYLSEAVNDIGGIPGFYCEIAAIKYNNPPVADNRVSVIGDTPEWTCKLAGVVQTKWYNDNYPAEPLNYCEPDVLKTGSLLGDELVRAIAAFNIKGCFLDSAYQHCKNQAEDWTDSDGVAFSSTAGILGKTWLDANIPLAQLTEPELKIISNNLWPLFDGTLLADKDTYYATMKANALAQDAALYMENVGIATNESDSAKTPPENYHQNYQDMTTAQIVLCDIVGYSMTFPTITNMHWSGARSKAWMYMCAALNPNNTRDWDDGLMLYQGQGEKAAQVWAQLLRFQARLSFFLTGCVKFSLIDDPTSTLSIASTQPLFWNKTVRTRTNSDGKKEVVIAMQNNPASGLIEGQTGIPTICDDAVLTIEKSIATNELEVYFADPNDATLPITLIPKTSEASTTISHDLPVMPFGGLVILREGDRLAMTKLASDTFGVAHADLDNQSLVLSNSADTWHVRAGSFETTGGRAYPRSAGVNLLTNDQNVENSEIKSRLNINNSGNQGLVFRYSDVDNYIYMRINAPGTATPDVQIWQREDGLDTRLDNVEVTSGSFSGDQEVVGRVQDDTLTFTITISGTAFTATAESSFNNTATQHGYYFNNAVGRADNFELWGA